MKIAHSYSIISGECNYYTTFQGKRKPKISLPGLMRDRIYLGVLYFYRLLDNIVAFVLHYLLRYRLHVIRGNMQTSLPYKNAAELSSAIRGYYLYLAKVFRQIMVRPVSGLLQKRMRWIPNPALDQWLAEGKSVLITFGHVGNWEWAGSYLGMQYPDQVCALYKKIKTSFINRLMFKRRLTHVNYLIEISQIGELLKLMKKKPVMVLMLSDQNPGSDQGLIWASFLGKDTAFVNGPESLGRRYHLPVVYLHIDADKHGGYELHCRTLFDGSEKVSEGEITQRFASALEENIMSNPIEWLWSHKRWKRKRK